MVYTRVRTDQSECNECHAEGRDAASAYSMLTGTEID